MFIKVLLFILSVVSFTFPSVVLAEKNTVLYVELNSKQKHIVVTARFGNEQTEFRISEPLEQLNADFGKLWYELDTWKVTKNNVESYLSRYEASFLTPLTHFLEKTEQIHFILDENSFDFALGLIPYKGNPLFVQYPISYSNKKVFVTKKGFYSATWSGLTISDHTADPDNAAYFLKSLFSNTQHFEMKKLSYRKFNQFSSKDVLLFSLHGERTESNAEMDLNEDLITAKDFAHFNSKLIYLDSCQMGSSFHFLKKLQNYGNEFFIAPLFSNEAGDSSSATIKNFFSYLKSGDSPAISMYKTRKSLFEKYSKSENADVAIWKAFPFRVYQQF